MVDNSQKTLEVTCPAFQDGGLIPIRYTAEAENVSPCIEWEGIPKGTESILIIAEDRDIPMPQIPLFTWVHWIVYNVPSDTSSIPEAVPVSETLEGGGQQGFTSYRKHGYSGPLPVSGTHKYYFTLYAVDIKVNLEPRKATKKRILKAIDGHILSKGVLMGRYRRQNNKK